MEFNIEKTVSEEAKEKNKVIFSLEEDVAKYLRSKDYGKDIKTYTIKLNCVNPPKGFEHLFKLLPPKYIDLKVSKNISTGQEQEFKKHFFCSINLIGVGWLPEVPSLPFYSVLLTKSDFYNFRYRK